MNRKISPYLGMGNNAPPEMLRTAPVIWRELMLAKKRTTLATSSDSPILRAGVPAKIRAALSDVRTGSVMGVLIQPGETAFTRVRGASSWASE
jgi:hypothetical protein